jgi:hypothetical protein
MNTKVLVSLSLFVGIGAVLHTFMPGIFFGMKPDMMLTMMFMGILFFPDKKNVLIIGIVTGILSGLTTQFPGGLIPNIVDKPVTALIFLGMLVFFKNRKLSIPIVAVFTAIGTIISGLVFLTSAMFIVGLPASFAGLFVAVVLPAAIINAITMGLIYPIVQSILKRTNMIPQG